MKKIMQRIMILSAVAMLGACASAPGEKFAGLAPTVADKGDVYLYRTKAFYANGRAFDVQVDGQKAGELFNASYLRFRLDSGPHTLKVSYSLGLGVIRETQEPVQVEAGKPIFYQYVFAPGSAKQTLIVATPLIGSLVSLHNDDQIVLREKSVAETDLTTLNAAQAGAANIPTASPVKASQ